MLKWTVITKPEQFRKRIVVSLFICKQKPFKLFAKKHLKYKHLLLFEMKYFKHYPETNYLLFSTKNDSQQQVCPHSFLIISLNLSLVDSKQF